VLRIGQVAPGCGTRSSARRAVIHADKEFWQPGWTDPDDEKYRDKIDQLTAQKAWVFDGIPGRVPDIVLPRADIVVWIEQPVWLCAVRSYARMLRYLGRTRPDMAQGCPERFNLALWRYATQFDVVTRPRINGWLQAYAPTTQAIRLEGDRAISNFIKREG
jgi:adenylate kinase family enzyme